MITQACWAAECQKCNNTSKKCKELVLVKKKDMNCKVVIRFKK